ncbi:hypothetical protein PMIN03_003833 [Paraphaeosphaeria minitans]|uniref:Uncharacterized protein n=1 Tax=Paraphaeosphaeria minitans TaxID=565426 RepID=A0A9P6KK67_9PLEO|nr:hypothetical protein PMIN01_12366 [Paraphaeosphaeria minitans]
MRNEDSMHAITTPRLNTFSQGVPWRQVHGRVRFPQTLRTKATDKAVGPSTATCDNHVRRQVGRISSGGSRRAMDGQGWKAASDGGVEVEAEQEAACWASLSSLAGV